MEKKDLVSQDSLATSRDRIKGTAAELSGGRFGPGLLHPLVSPAGPVFHDPIAERFFEANISSGLFALDPFVFQNFFPLREELLVEHRVFNELRLFAFARGHVGTVHIRAGRSIKTICSLRRSSGYAYSILGGTCFCVYGTSRSSSLRPKPFAEVGRDFHELRGNRRVAAFRRD